MTIDKQQLREAASEASMLVEDVDGSWAELVNDLRVEGERLPSELAVHIELASPPTVIALLDEIECLRRLTLEACEIATMSLNHLDRNADAKANRILTIRQEAGL